MGMLQQEISAYQLLQCDVDRFEILLRKTVSILSTFRLALRHLRLALDCDRTRSGFDCKQANQTLGRLTRTEVVLTVAIQLVPVRTAEL
jgi:hypothetical protein